MCATVRERGRAKPPEDPPSSVGRMNVDVVAEEDIGCDRTVPTHRREHTGFPKRVPHDGTSVLALLDRPGQEGDSPILEPPFQARPYVVRHFVAVGIEQIGRQERKAFDSRAVPLLGTTSHPRVMLEIVEEYRLPLMVVDGAKQPQGDLAHDGPYAPRFPKVPQVGPSIVGRSTHDGRILAHGIGEVWRARHTLRPRARDTTTRPVSVTAPKEA